jgi:dihydropteroate synthase
MKKPPIRLLGVINVSPESFYKGSVPRNERALAALAKRLTKEGADMLDVGAMSTAPYLKTKISETEEAKRLSWAVRVIRKNSRLPISADTARFKPALAALNAGASYLNDVTGLHGDPKLANIARRFKGVILMAHPSVFPRLNTSAPIQKIKRILSRAVKTAVRNGVPRSKIIIDPGIGFFRDENRPWWQWDLLALYELEKLKSLKCLILVGVSRKSFIGKLMGGVPPEKRLSGSLAAAGAAVKNGAGWIRTHDVKETKLMLRGVARKGARRRRAV